jgi:uncharacterized protein YjbJ (UPF0337 family)
MVSYSTPEIHGGATMDKDRVKGTIDEVVGNAKRHVGKLTGNTEIQIEGAVQQIKGKIENVVGKLKDAERDAEDQIVTAREAQEADEATRREERKARLVHDHNLM